MKTSIRTNSGTKENKVLNSSGQLLYIMTFIILGLCCIPMQAQNSINTITIYGTKFTYPLIEKWINEYSRLKPGVVVKLLKDPGTTERVDLRVVAFSQHTGETNNTSISVGRYALLPITNIRNRSLPKEFRNGFSRKDLETIFMRKKEDWEEEPVSKKKQDTYKVYTRTPQSSSAQVLAEYFNRPSTDLSGTFVAGDDRYLTSVILKDTTGIGYNPLGLIYDLNNRRPLAGLKVLPIDLNNNNRLDKNEQIFDNLDQVITHLENEASGIIPTGYIRFEYDPKQHINSAELDFISWVTEDGQQYNHAFGFLKINPNGNELSFSQK